MRKDRSKLRIPGLEISPRRALVRWPEGGRLAVALTVDCYDSNATSVHHMIGSNLDFAVNRGIWNILEFLADHRVPATFNMAGATAEANPALASAIDRAGHEVAVLGYRHEPHWKFTKDEERSVIERAAAAMAAAIGKRPAGWRTPQARPSVHTLPLLAEAGFAWDSSLRNDEIPYALQFDAGTIIEIPAGGSNDDTSYLGFPYPVTAADSVLSVWLDELEMLHGESREQASMIVFSLSPGFIGRRTGLSMMRDLIDRIRSLNGAWFARCIDLADHWNANSHWTERDAA